MLARDLDSTAGGHSLKSHSVGCDMLGSKQRSNPAWPGRLIIMIIIIVIINNNNHNNNNRNNKNKRNKNNNE